MNVDKIKAQNLAYIGDAYYELVIREFILKEGIVKSNLLQKEAIRYVSAKAQAAIVKYLIDNEILSEKEIDIIKRGRNAKVTSKSKNVDIVTYKYSTGFETLIGYLYLGKDTKRLNELLEYSKDIIKEINT